MRPSLDSPLSATDLQFELVDLDGDHLQDGQLLDQLSRLGSLQVALLHVPGGSLQVQAFNVTALQQERLG